MSQTALIDQKQSQLVLLIDRERSIRLVRSLPALRAVETVPKCASEDMPGPGGLPNGHPVSDNHEGVMHLSFPIRFMMTRTMSGGSLVIRRKSVVMLLRSIFRVGADACTRELAVGCESLF